MVGEHNWQSWNANPGLSTVMVEPIIVGTAGKQTWELSAWMVGAPHNGYSRCTNLEIQHRDGGAPP